MSPQEVEQVEKNGLKKCLAKPRGDTPHIFFLCKSFTGQWCSSTKHFTKNTGAKEDYLCSLTSIFTNVGLKFVVFSSSDFEVFFPIISAFHLMHLVSLQKLFLG